MIPAAFYAPLKAPDHPTPSGDRTIAQGLMMALSRAGYAPELASDLRLLDIHGDTEAQVRLEREAAALVPELVEKGRAAHWRLWVTYHNYYKAPDLLGPTVARGLGIPYVQIESTRARKRLYGPWARFAQAAEDAADAARIVFFLTTRDAEALRSYALPGRTLVHLRPFLLRDDLPPVSTRQGPMLTAAMMRPGDKLESYKVIARMLEHVDGHWRLDIAGDGAARDKVRRLMEPFGARVRFLGRLDAEGMADAYCHASLLVWPGVNEAIGLVYLEAQAAGIPVLAQDRPGLCDVLAPGTPAPDPDGGAGEMAHALQQALHHPPTADALRVAHFASPSVACGGRDVATRAGGADGMTARLALMRHGKTAWNRARRIQGRTDVSLDDAARQELRGISLVPPWDRATLWASPLSRARETARIIAGREPSVTHALTEMNWGDWEGLRGADLIEQRDSGYRHIEDWGWEFTPPGGERPLDIRRRLEEWMKTLTGDNLAICHIGVMRVALAMAWGWDFRGPCPFSVKRNRLYILERAGDGWRPQAVPLRLVELQK